MIERQQLLVGATWENPSSDATIEVRSPHDRHLVAVVPQAAPADVDVAVDRATSALHGSWGSAPPRERAELVRRLSGLMQTRSEEIAALITDEMGSPSKFSLFGQVFAATTVLDGFADLADSFAFEQERPGIVGPCLVQKVPVGVAVGIVPWNVPLFITCMKLGAALIAGAPIILKPSPEAPVSSFLLADLLVEAGVPEGVVSVLPGGAELGRYLVSHPGVDKVSFTGSTAAGRTVGATCGELLKRCTLELGGKSAGIVLDDADLATAVPQLLDAGLQNNGQVCAAQTRILVPRHQQDAIVDAMVAHVEAMVVGDPREPDTDVGPVVTARQRERIEGYIGGAVDDGARLVVGGGRPEGFDDGFYVQPTVFADVDNRSRIAREEVFGPVLTVIPYDGVDDAVRLANESDFGLSGSVWTADPDRGVEVASRVRTGTCAVNSGVIVEPRNPFGGFRSSGIGREMGPEGLESYLETRTVVLPFG